MFTRPFGLFWTDEMAESLYSSGVISCGRANIYHSLSNGSLKIEAPLSIEVSLMRQGNRWCLHLVNFHQEKSSNFIEDLPEIRKISVRIKRLIKTRRIHLAIGERDIPWQKKGNYLYFTIPGLIDHEIVIIE